MIAIPYLQPVPLPTPTLGTDTGIAALLEHFNVGVSRHTKAQRAATIRALAGFLQVSETEAIRRLLASNVTGAHTLALSFLQRLIEANYSPETVNARISGLRGLTKLARQCGLIEWQLEIRVPTVTPSKDMRGPKFDAVDMLLVSAARDTPERLRDVAICTLLLHAALRRQEITTLNLDDYSSHKREIAVLGKGRRTRQMFPINERCQVALDQYIEARGKEPGPLFLSSNTNRMGERRLDPATINNIVAAVTLGSARPHGLRHAGITKAEEERARQQLPLQALQDFARHKSIKTTARYMDRDPEQLQKLVDALAVK
jgi:site-specific recombinase XerD